MAQFANPDSDISVGSWSWTNSMSEELWEQIDEGIASTDDSTTYAETFGPATFEVGLESLSEPDSGTRTVRIRAAGSSATMNVVLKANGSTKQSWSHSVNGSYATYSQTITASLTSSDYANLSISVSLSGFGSLSVSTIEFEVPDAAAGGGGGEGPKLHPEFFIMLL